MFPFKIFANLFRMSLKFLFILFIINESHCCGMKRIAKIYTKIFDYFSKQNLLKWSSKRVEQVSELISLFIHSILSGVWFDEIFNVFLKISSMCGSSKPNHSFQYVKPRLLIKYFEQSISERFIVIVVVISDECL